MASDLRARASLLLLLACDAPPVAKAQPPRPTVSAEIGSLARAYERLGAAKCAVASLQACLMVCSEVVPDNGRWDTKRDEQEHDRLCRLACIDGMHAGKAVAE